MTQLTEVLKKLRWGAYEASVYDTLVIEGPLKANDVALKAGVPVGRIYGVLGDLEKKGYVRRRGKRPTIYDAQHPRSVIGKELEMMKAEADVALVKAEEAWEVRSEQHENGLENAWAVSGLFGVVTEFRRLAKEAKKSILILDPNLEWFQKQDQDLLLKLNGKGDVKVLSSLMSKDELESLTAEKLSAKMLDSLDEAFYIFDGINLLLRVGSPDGGVILKNEGISVTLSKRFDELYGKAKEVEVKKVAT
jgi:sugar-specific transcriptional regulator TrmB